MLVMVTAFWGVSYFMMDACLEEMDPLSLNAFRFLGAFGVVLLLAFNRIKTVNRQTLKYAFFVAIALVLTYLSVTYGIKYTTQSNAGFFCATTVVFTPVLAFFLKKVVPGKKLGFVVLICIIGITLMSLDANMKIAIGDLLCLFCGFIYAVDLLITETAVKRDDVNAFQLGVFQLGFTGVIMLILSIVLETPCLPQTPVCWLYAIFLSVFCTGATFIMQAVAQQHTTATHVGVIFALEPVLAAIVAFIFAGERLLPRAYAGMVLMLAGILIMEIDLKKIFRAPFGRSSS